MFIIFARVLLALFDPLKKVTSLRRAPYLEQSGVEALAALYDLKYIKWFGQQFVLSNNNQVDKLIGMEDCRLGNFHGARRPILVNAVDTGRRARV